MPVSPRKNISYVTNSTVNKGVQTREVDIVNVRLDTDALSLSRAVTEGSEIQAELWGSRGGNIGVRRPGIRDGAMAAGDASTVPSPLTPPSTDQSVSYVQQVVVEKQRRSGARRPVASSPMRAELVHPSLPTAGLESSAIPAAILLACPAFTALHQQSWEKARGFCEPDTCGEQAASTAPRTHVGKDTYEQNRINIEKIKKEYFWKKVQCLYKHDAGDYDDGPDCMEVYEFDHGCEVLVARGVGAVSCIERRVRHVSRPATALLAELLAVPRLMLAAPVHIALQLQRCVLLGVREVATGVVQTTADTIVKPMLALAFNAVLHPPLVCAAQLAQALREALHPVALALADALEPLKRLLSAIRLVHVERHCTCGCAHHV